MTSQVLTLQRVVTGFTIRGVAIRWAMSLWSHDHMISSLNGP